MSDPIRFDRPPIAAPAHWPTPQICVVRLAGDLDLATAPRLLRYLREQTSAGPTHLVLDFTEVRFFSSSGIHVILTAMTNSDGLRGRLHLIGVTHNRLVARVLDLCGLLPLLDLHDNLADLLDHPDHD